MQLLRNFEVSFEGKSESFQVCCRPLINKRGHLDDVTVHILSIFLCPSCSLPRKDTENDQILAISKTFNSLKKFSKYFSLDFIHFPSFSVFSRSGMLIFPENEPPPNVQLHPRPSSSAHPSRRFRSSFWSRRRVHAVPDRPEDVGPLEDRPVCVSRCSLHRAATKRVVPSAGED